MTKTVWREQSYYQARRDISYLFIAHVYISTCIPCTYNDQEKEQTDIK
jgi:hypothetical protein